MCDPVKSHPGVPDYHGPADMAELWHQFSSGYTARGGLRFEAQAATLLDQLAFGRRAEEMAAEYAAHPQSLRHIRYVIEDAALALSTAAEDPKVRPLQRAVLSALVEQWVDAERRYGVDPLETRDMSRATMDERRVVETKRLDLLRSPLGSLLSGTIRMMEYSTLRAQANIALRRLGHLVTYDDALSLASQPFYRALFKYRPDQGTSFSGYLWQGLQDGLPTAIGRYVKSAKDGRKLPLETLCIDDELAVALHDHHEQAPSHSLHTTEQQALVLQAVSGLPDRERNVITLRYGLNGAEPLSLKEIGKRIGLTVQRIEQIEKSALRRCRARCEIDHKGRDR